MIDHIYRYHEITKHRLTGYAPSPGFLDWDSQPDAFRTFKGCTLKHLPHGYEDETQFDDLHRDKIPVKDWNHQNLGAFFELSMGLSAWKHMGPDRWALRMNPSSGNLHPTESYLLSWAQSNTMDQGVFHYNVYQHGLEQRGTWEPEQSQSLQTAFPGAFGAIGLSTISWREEWKYGERAYRYCQLDVGHAIGALCYSAALMGWGLTLLDLNDDRLAHILGLDRESDFDGVEKEEPDLLLLLHPRGLSFNLKADIFNALETQWYGIANQLSPERVAWPHIKAVKKATIKSSDLPYYKPSLQPQTDEVKTDKQAVTLIRNRRSAQRMDKETSLMDKASWYKILRRLSLACLPFDALNTQASVSLLLMVHHVEGIESGLYFLERKSGHAEDIKSLSQAGYLWEEMPYFPNLYKLQAPIDARKTASQFSCLQSIAGHGAFAISMLADFKQLQELGSWAYRLLHWEAGLIGQSLYLEAENTDLNGTGIGCFFDDEIHALMGLPQTNGPWQVIYHFTIGKAPLDDRLETSPPFAHLSQ
jgi:SagB-type dehydrogenase family enzyme